MTRCLATEPIDSRPCASAREIPLAERLCLPGGYRQNARRARRDPPEEYWTPERIRLNHVHQNHVYVWTDARDQMNVTRRRPLVCRAALCRREKS